MKLVFVPLKDVFKECKGKRQFSIKKDAYRRFSSVSNEMQIGIKKIAALYVEQAKSSQTPWTLDPVAVGALDYRRHFCHELLSFKPAAIRGNASEIMALAGIANGGRGVDTTDAAANAIPAAQTLARETGAIVVVTGEVDYVTDGHRAVGIHGGDPLMTKVVGTGCALSAVVAACCALPGDTLENVASACHWMKQAGERAVARSEGPGSFVPHFLDALWQLTQEVQA